MKSDITIGKRQFLLSTPETDAALALEYGADDRWEYGWQVKVIDPAGFLNVVKPVLEARLYSSRWHGKPYSLSMGLFGPALRLDWDGGRLAVVDGISDPGESGSGSAESCAIPPELFAPIVLGYRSVAELRRQRHDLSAYGDAETFLDDAFPVVETFVHYFI